MIAISTLTTIHIERLKEIESVIKTKERNSSINDLVADNYIQYLLEVIKYYLGLPILSWYQEGHEEQVVVQRSLDCLLLIAQISFFACSELIHCKTPHFLHQLLQIDSQTQQYLYSKQCIECLLLIGESEGTLTNSLSVVSDYLLRRMIQERQSYNNNIDSNPIVVPLLERMIAPSLKLISTLYNIEDHYHHDINHFINVLELIKWYLITIDHQIIRLESKRSLTRLFKHLYSFILQYNNNNNNTQQQQQQQQHFYNSVYIVLFSSSSSPTPSPFGNVDNIPQGIYIFQSICKQSTMLLDLETLDLFLSILKIIPFLPIVDINNQQQQSNNVIIKAIINTIIKYHYQHQQQHQSTLLLRCYESLSILMNSNNSNNNIDILLNMDRYDYQFLNQLASIQQYTSIMTTPIDYSTKQLIISKSLFILGVVNGDRQHYIITNYPHLILFITDFVMDKVLHPDGVGESNIIQSILFTWETIINQHSLLLNYINQQRQQQPQQPQLQQLTLLRHQDINSIINFENSNLYQRIKQSIIRMTEKTIRFDSPSLYTRLHYVSTLYKCEQIDLLCFNNLSL